MQEAFIILERARRDVLARLDRYTIINAPKNFKRATRHVLEEIDDALEVLRKELDARNERANKCADTQS